MMLDLKEIGCDGVAAVVIHKPQVVVFTHQTKLSSEGREVIRSGWKEATAGTALEHVKAIILDGGLQLSIVDEGA